jgi:hypothetical protein
MGVAARESAAAYSLQMPRRESPPPKDFAFDFTADWSGVAAKPPGSEAARGWTLHGTVTKRGQTYGLAHRNGLYAACTDHGLIFELTAIERSRISSAAHFKTAPGWENAPKPVEHAAPSITLPAQNKQPKGYSTPRSLEGVCDACCEPCYVWQDVGGTCLCCGKGVFRPGYFWRFVTWPDGKITATPADWVTKRDVERLDERRR